MEEEEKDLSDATFICSTCNKHFSTARTLQSHQDKAICLGKQYICLRCLDIFPHLSYLKKHQKNIRKCQPCLSVTITKGPNQELHIKKN